ncbi:uncharacterized protein [Mycetomoellerius zeteki]|nr:PREDICTED: uncharacterized protein LOC108728228 isoform X1 [Trachymyrmex zeteki]XP_018312193.1 PREDICTED: uncharacterized protein LOC108728228 isoform X1 [Trachymyrmex zeteki]
MTRIYLLIFCYIFNSALSEPATWLMQGDEFTEDEVTSRIIQLESHESYSPVSSRAEMYYRARPGKLINCVIAASVYQQGHVSVVKGGYRDNYVRINYMTESGKADVFYVFVQTVKSEAVFVDENSRLGIVYEELPMRN